MKLPTSPRVMSRRGMTLLETTVVLAALIVVVAILFTGVRGWKRGGDRVACILAIRNVQLATRCYQNTYGFDYGSRLPETGFSSIGRHLFKRGYIGQRTYDEIRGVRRCPAGGNYLCPFPDLFPPLGIIYLQCSLAAEGRHSPTSADSW